MQQPSVADYFKVKKRTRDGVGKHKKSSKLVAISSTETGKKTPNRISVVSDTSSPDEPSPAKYFSPCRQKDIFSSPVKLNEIRSPVKASPILGAKSAVKRLFFADTSSDADPCPGLKSSKVPAYERFSHLAQKSPDGKLDSTPVVPVPGPSTSKANVEETSGPLTSTSLQLPFKYNVLLELFRAVETVVSIFLNRKETITFLKLKPAVQELMRKISLKEKHLGQMLHVFPDCYKLYQEKVKTGYNEQSYQLCLAVNYAALPNVSASLTSSNMTERREIFQKNLVNLCQEHHKNFLLSLETPIVIPPGKKVTRWHPKFRLDEVPDIPVVPLPRPPESSKMSNTTAKEVIAKAQDILQGANPRMKKALEDLRKKTEAARSSSTVPDEQPSASPQHVKGLAPQLAESAAGLKISDPAVDRHAATKLAIAKAQEALLKKARLDPKKAKALQDILAKNGKSVNASVSSGSSKIAQKLTTPAPPAAASALDQRNAQEDKPVSKKPNELAALKGISTSLLEKIRAREQEKSIRAMTMTPEETKRRTMLNRLPEFVKILRNTMIAENKTAMHLRIVIDRVCHSCRGSLGELDSEQHIRLLADIVPEWLTLIKSSQGEYMKIDKTLNINDLLEKLYEIIRRTK